MRRLMARVLCASLLLNCSACTMLVDMAMDPEDPGLNPFDNPPKKKRRSPPATDEVSSLRPAPTPGKALERAIQAAVDADEAAYRRIVLIKSPYGHSEACARWGLASARLHRAVREHNVTGQRVREAGWDRNETLSPNNPDPPSAKEWEAERKAIRGMRWEVNGDIARPKDRPDMYSRGTQGDTSFERLGDGWIVVIADPNESASVDLQRFAKGWSAMALAIDATTARVNAGEFKTMRQVNDFFDARLKEIEQAEGS
jgi:hypothetical protein